MCLFLMILFNYFFLAKSCPSQKPRSPRAIEEFIKFKRKEASKQQIPDSAVLLWALDRVRGQLVEDLSSERRDTEYMRACVHVCACQRRVLGHLCMCVHLLLQENTQIGMGCAGLGWVCVWLEQEERHIFRVELNNPESSCRQWSSSLRWAQRRQ